MSATGLMAIPATKTNRVIHLLQNGRVCTPEMSPNVGPPYVAYMAWLYSRENVSRQKRT
jgi:hypothetical protein